ncbi:MAG TPA: DUF2235 domain-containing protein, partial [Albitalea sp.]
MDDTRQIVICCDGTNNTVTGRERDTNVLRLYERILSGADASQLLYYDPGVGSPDALPPTDPIDWIGRKWERVAGLASGRGAFENIGQAYLFLMQHWRPGTKVFVFGFSRGAFTARAVAGMVNLFGIIEAHHDALLPTLLRVYFAPRGDEVPPSAQRRRQRMAQTFAGVEMEANVSRTREQVAQQLRESFASPDGAGAGVHFIGVWDTVAAIGMPGLALRISSHATISGKRMAHARHALSLDEHRLSFAPRLYTENDFGAPQEAQSLRQRWFRGGHGDSGGGYAPAESALSDEALRWMALEAIDCGLRCRPFEASTARPLVHDAVHTIPWWSTAGLALRNSTPATAAGTPLMPVEHPSVDGPTPPSVWRERRSWAPLALALLGCVLFALAQGELLLGRWALPQDALNAGARFAAMQLSMLWTAADWRTAWQGAPAAMPASAVVADFGLVASYA